MYFSGYEDISNIPEDCDSFLWFYQVPIKYDINELVAEVKSYIGKFDYVVQQIPKDKPIIVLTLVSLYSVKLVGNDFRLKEAISDFNHHVVNVAMHNSNVKVIDDEEFFLKYPSSEWIDWKYYFISQQIINPRLAKAFKNWYAKRLDEIELKRKKCLVLDLDNTLWGGILGEDGINGIKIGGDYPGKAFLYFQQGIVQLAKNGVIITICSKNNEKDVLELWEKNPFIVLGKEYISAYQINWNNKADNIVSLSKDLNIGLDSMVFVDDNPSERELVRQSLPMVSVPEFPKHPYELPVFFKDLVERYFGAYQVTKEDKNKVEQYKANAIRAKEQAKFTDFHSFLRSLDIHLEILPIDEFNLSRIAQMTQKTNQFNLTTRRYSEEDVKHKWKIGWKIWCLSVSDRFGDSGITGCILVDGNRIDELLLSCRILGKNIEYAFVKTVMTILRKNGIKELKAEYIPTQKNSQVSDFFDKCGFKLLSKVNGIKVYEADLESIDLSVEDYYKITYNHERKNN